MAMWLRQSKQEVKDEAKEITKGKFIRNLRGHRKDDFK